MVRGWQPKAPRYLSLLVVALAGVMKPMTADDVWFQIVGVIDRQ